MTFSSPKGLTRRMAGGLLLALVSGLLVSCGTLQIAVDVQEPTTPTPTPIVLPGDVFANCVVLLGYSASSLEVTAGGEWPLRLYWEVKATPPRPYALDFRVKDSDGRLAWSYGDNTISWVPGQLVTEHRLPISEHLNEGYYGLEVMLWDPASRTRAPATGPDGPRQNDVVPVARLYVKGKPVADSTPRALPTFVPVVTAVFTTTARP